MGVQKRQTILCVCAMYVWKVELNKLYYELFSIAKHFKEIKLQQTAVKEKLTGTNGMFKNTARSHKLPRLCSVVPHTHKHCRISYCSYQKPPRISLHYHNILSFYGNSLR